MEKYDCIIVGLGCSGLMSLERISRNKKVLGIDKNGVNNKQGSSHGESRIYRLSYYEGTEYLPMLEESVNIWKKIEEKTGEELLKKDEIIFMTDGSNEEKHELCKKSCEEADIKYEILKGDDINNRYNHLSVNKNVKAITHEKAGTLKSGKALRTVEKMCSKRPETDIIQGEISEYNIKENQVKVSCDGKEYKANKIVFATGPWSKKQFHILDFLDIENHTYCLYKDKDKSITPFISYIKDSHFYGLPSLEKHNIKIGELGEDEKVEDMEEFKRKGPSKDRVERNKNFVKNKFKIDYNELDAMVCPITRTPDDDYIIDYHPKNDNIILCTGMSGHGFKTSSQNGKIVCDLVNDKYNKYSSGMFSIDRFL